MRKIILLMVLGLVIGLSAVSAQANDPIVGDWRIVGTNDTVQIRAVPGYTGKFSVSNIEFTHLFRVGNSWVIGAEGYWFLSSVTLSGNSLLITHLGAFGIQIATPLVRR